MISTAAGRPSNVTAEQGSDPYAVVISWTAPDSGDNVTGYRIYYHAEGDQGSVDVAAGVTEFMLTGLCPGLTYNISLVALSVHLPSSVVELDGVILGELCMLCNINYAKAYGFILCKQNADACMEFQLDE